MDSLNHSLFLAINASPGASGPIVWFAIFAAKYLIYAIPLHLILLWVAGDRHIRFVALTALLGLLFGIVLNALVGAVFVSPRPFAIGLGTTLIEHRANSSMPSNHATVFFTYGIGFWLIASRSIAVATAGAGLLVAWSRIYLGIHYPLDMAVAVLTSLVAAGAACSLMRRYGDVVLRPAEALWARIIGFRRTSVSVRPAPVRPTPVRPARH